MSEAKRTSPWVWIGCGCGVAILIVAVAITALGFFGVRKAREIGRDIQDPARRESKVMAILGAETLPAGYYPMLGLSVPFITDIAMLSDKPSDDSGEPQGFDQRGFIFFEMFNFGREQEELREFFEGKTDDARVLRRHNINLRVGERLANGEVNRDDSEILWVAHRGRIDVMGTRQNGITTLILFDCPEDRRLRMGIWFAPMPGATEAEREEAEEKAVEAVDGADAAPSELDLTGSPADRVAVEAFVSGLRPCGA